MKALKVWWTDPDGACSRFYEAEIIKFWFFEGVVEIEEADGSYLERPIEELSWPSDMSEMGPLWVQGSKDTPYIIKKNEDHYSCTCPAWRYQEPEIKTCKHLKKLRGREAEALRVGKNYK